MSDMARMFFLAQAACNGGGSGPSEVVILPETVLETIEGTFVGATPLSNVPTDGATAVITYNGVEYTSPIIYVAQNAIFAMGNTEALGLQGGNADAPFMVALSPSGYDGQYVSVMPLDDATSVTISIVQVGAASGGDTGGYLYITGMAEDSEADSTNVTMSMPFEVVLAAVHSGKPVFCALHNFKGDTLIYVLQVTGYSDWAVLFVVDLGQNYIEMMWTENGGCVASFLS